MSKIRLDAQEIKYITLFENMTGAKVRDCVTEKGTLGFLVEEGNMGLAIGKRGINITRTSKVLGKQVLVMESLSDMTKFIGNLFQPQKVRSCRIIEQGTEKVALIEIKRRDKSKIIGNEGVRINIAKKLAERHFGINNIKIRAV